MITQRTWPAVMTLCLAFVVGSVMSAQTPPAGNDLFARAAAAARQGNSGSARSYAGQALEISRRTHDRSLEANCLLLLGQLEASEGNFLEALQDFRASLPIWTEIKGWNGGALAMDEIGSAYRQLDQPDKAVDSYLTALRLRRLLGDRPGEGRTMANIGMAYADMKRFEEAVSYFKQSAPVLLETGDKLGAAKLLSTTGQYYETIADYRAALDFFEKCLRVAADIHDNAEEARARRDIERVRAKLEPPAPRR